jgi:FMN phosphatase YigB (HAD superfamily)
LTSIIFDWKRTLYDPDRQTLVDGAVDVLSYFYDRKILLYLIGKGNVEMYDETNRLDVAKYFTDILFVESTKDTKDFIKYIDVNNPQNTWVIGDRIRSEIAVGKSIGATTIWIKQSKFAGEIPENDSQKPNFIIENIREILELNDLDNQ